MTMTDREFWIQVRRGLLTVVSAIEYRWNLPRGSGFTIGAAPSEEATHLAELPQNDALARSSSERVG
jgi:hypothetical protein